MGWHSERDNSFCILLELKPLSLICAVAYIRVATSCLREFPRRHISLSTSSPYLAVYRLTRPTRPSMDQNYALVSASGTSCGILSLLSPNCSLNSCHVVLLWFDLILTFSDEYQHIWRHDVRIIRLSAVQMAYILVRYGSLEIGRAHV